MDRKFQRTEEDFICENCTFEVRGNGYTNHCPRCLWSKHVDVNPGDRAEACGGMMEPKYLAITGGQYTILHRCTTCGFERRNRTSTHDNFEALLLLSRNQQEDETAR